MNKKQEKFYCLVLSRGQLQFLTDPLQGKSRCACLFSLMLMADEDSTVLGESDAKSMTGEVNASKLQLAAQWAINRKTVDKMMSHFNEQGLVTTRSTTQGSVHILNFLSGWIVGKGEVKKNPHYVRPTSEPQTRETETTPEKTSRTAAHVDNVQTPTNDSGMVAHADNDNDGRSTDSNNVQPTCNGAVTTSTNDSGMVAHVDNDNESTCTDSNEQLL